MGGGRGVFRSQVPKMVFVTNAVLLQADILYFENTLRLNIAMCFVSLKWNYKWSFNQKRVPSMVINDMEGIDVFTRLEGNKY